MEGEGRREGGRENMRATWQHATLFSSIDWKILKDLKRKRSWEGTGPSRRTNSLQSGFNDQAMSNTAATSAVLERNTSIEFYRYFNIFHHCVIVWSFLEGISYHQFWWRSISYDNLRSSRFGHSWLSAHHLMHWWTKLQRKRCFGPWAQEIQSQQKTNENQWRPSAARNDGHWWKLQGFKMIQTFRRPLNSQCSMLSKLMRGWGSRVGFTELVNDCCSLSVMHVAMQVLQINGSPGMRLRGSEKESRWTQMD